MSDDVRSAIFASSFVLVWIGAAVITLNAFLLGGTLGFFQSVCIIGYCVFPLMLSAFLCYLWANMLFRIVVVLLAFAWAVVASVGFFAGVVPEGRKVLAMYPVILFYLVLGWMIILATNPQTAAPLPPPPAPAGPWNL